jgi:16S rRNA (guanine527-N7)-methyltransferase
MSLIDDLSQRAVTFGVSLSPQQASDTLQYLLELEKWNRTYDLTAVATVEEMVYRHALDSLSIAPYIPLGEVLDLGSGAGLPGIPLALALPRNRFVLIEPLGKRVRFLNHVVRLLKLDNVRVFEGRAESYPGAPADAVCVRAVASLRELTRLAAPLLAPGGVLLAMKGSTVAQELAGSFDGFATPEQIALEVPNAPGARWLIRLQRL